MLLKTNALNTSSNWHHCTDSWLFLKTKCPWTKLIPTINKILGLFKKNDLIVCLALFAACIINNMTLPYGLSATSVQSCRVTSSLLTWCMQCFSLLFKVLGVCVCVCHCLGMWFSRNVLSLCVCVYVDADVLVFVVKIWTRPGVQRLIRLVVHQIIKYVTGEELQK